ncbi:glycosyltransferase [Serratia sp. 3ACOL1]|uniref:glycosyltransferase n=1 Tax=Serratia sp. 3ACOL1 TaxID=2448483 RepID=UPI000EF51960|nr:glycosyltransferase [Serratia sp. 3ACOL1]AYM89681.1 glycosyltransferase [Serratia sp. 3ACOL1]
MAKLTESRKVSVYISTCNRLDKLKRAVESVLRQDYANIEVLICDDASSDGTQEYVKDLLLRDKRFVYLRNNVNKGACATRNLGITSATGYFITGLDDDDEFKSNRLAYFLSNWEDKYSFICANFTNVHPNGHKKDHYKKCNTPLLFSYKKILFENEASNQIFTITKRLQKIGGFDPSVKRLQDWDTWLRLSYEFGDFLRLPISTYIMNHDHAFNEIRVSQNAKITESLIGLVDRNRVIYSEKERNYMIFLVSCMNKKATLLDSLYWSLLKLNPKYLIKYMLQ